MLAVPIHALKLASAYLLGRTPVVVILLILVANLQGVGPGQELTLGVA